MDGGSTPLLPWNPDPDSLRAKLLRYLLEHGESSISSMANDLLYGIANVRDKLNVAERHGHVRSETKKVIYPSGQMIMSHAYTITEEGKKWLELAEHG